MIVKNEIKILKDCFDSIVDYLDYWVICDTGSTDGTQKFIENYFKEKNIQGELHQDVWVNFGYNRSKYLEKAYNKADYLLLLDADFIVDIKNKNFKTELSNVDAYYILQNTGSINYHNLKLVS
jgi:glycosyltransferase involved in cell wall biosynthesis